MLYEVITDRGGFSGSVGAEEPEYFPPLHVEGEPVDGRERAEFFRQALDPDRGIFVITSYSIHYTKLYDFSPAITPNL